jgi:transposase
MAFPLSQDLRGRLVRAVAEGSSIRQAAARFDVSPSSAIKLMQRVRRTGSTAPARIGGYRRPLLDGHEALLRELTRAKPGITLVEIKGALAERGIEAGHISTIWTTLRRLGLSHKTYGPPRRQAVFAR